jgi:hypothetical protein
MARQSALWRSINAAGIVIAAPHNNFRNKAMSISLVQRPDMSREMLHG